MIIYITIVKITTANKSGLVEGGGERLFVATEAVEVKEDCRTGRCGICAVWKSLLSGEGSKEGYRLEL